MLTGKPKQVILFFLGSVLKMEKQMCIHIFLKQIYVFFCNINWISFFGKMVKILDVD